MAPAELTFQEELARARVPAEVPIVITSTPVAPVPMLIVSTPVPVPMAIVRASDPPAPMLIAVAAVVPIATVLALVSPKETVPTVPEAVPASMATAPELPAEALPLAMLMPPVPPAMAAVLMAMAPAVLAPDWIVRVEAVPVVDQVEAAPPVNVSAPAEVKEDAPVGVRLTEPAPEAVKFPEVRVKAMSWVPEVTMVCPLLYAD